MLSVNNQSYFDDIIFNDKTVEVVLWNGVVVWKKTFRLFVSPTKITIPTEGVSNLKLTISSNLDWKIE